jgi:hypothetical protein
LKQHLKIPKNWQNVRWEHRNIYIAYLWVKKQSEFGRIHISKIPQKNFHHWLRKLVSVGFIVRKGDYYVILSYQKVWKLLGIDKVRVSGRRCFRFRKLPQYYDTWGEFKKKLIDDIQGYLAERKKAQFRHRLVLPGGVRRTYNEKPMFSGAAAAKLFGYNSRISGSKYRNKFFDIVEEPLRLRKRYTSDHLPYFQYECKKIHLKTIFH